MNLKENDIIAIFRDAENTLDNDVAQLEQNLIISKDLLLENVHFRLKNFSPAELAYKALAVNVSDILASGGVPLYVILGVSYPYRFALDYLIKFCGEFKKLCDKYNIKILGGDTTSSRSGFVISITIIGKTDSVISRSSAKINDDIYVTGFLGDSSAGLYCLENNIQEETLIKVHKMPRVLENFPKIKANAAMDISDGLNIDLSRLINASNCGALINLNSIPISPELKKFCQKYKLDPFKFALFGGEDYEILFTSDTTISRNTFKVGKITSGKGIIYKLDDQIKTFNYQDFDHF